MTRGVCLRGEGQSDRHDWKHYFPATLLTGDKKKKIYKENFFSTEKWKPWTIKLVVQLVEAVKKTNIQLDLNVVALNSRSFFDS